MYHLLLIINRQKSRICGYLVLCLLLAASIKSEAQGFDKDGNYSPAANNHSFYDPATLPYTVPGSVPPLLTPNFISTAVASTQTTNSFKQRLLDRVNSAIFNLQNDSLKLKDIYEAIKPGFYIEYLTNLATLRTYLMTNHGNPTYNLLPTKAQIDAWSGVKIYTVVKDNQWTTNDVLGFDLIQKDAMSDWLYTNYAADLSADGWLSTQELDMGYVKMWRDLEAKFKKVQEARAYAEKINGDIFKYDQKTFHDLLTEVQAIDINADPIIKHIKESTFLKKWLWYEAGVPGIDPLLVTTDDRQYPRTEPNTYFTVDKKKLQDTLDKDKTGLMTKFGQTSKYANLLFLPQRSAWNKDHIYLLEISAGDTYTTLNPLPDNKLEKDKLMIAVYNIPGDKKLTLATSTDKLVYQSGVSKTLSYLADQVSTLTAIASPNIAIFNNLTAALNTPRITPVQVGTAAPGGGGGARMAFDDAVEEKSASKKVRATYVKGNYVSLSGKSDDDKKRILLAGTTEQGDESVYNYNPAIGKVIDEFIVEDAAIRLNYSSTDDFNDSQNDLDTRFNTFQDKIKGWYTNLKDLSALAKTKFEQLDPFIRITNRSLPPNQIKVTTDTVPLKRTLLNTPTTPDPPQKLIYTITEQSTKDKSPAKQVVKQSLNVIQTQLFDFSVGIGYTFPQYFISTPGSPLPTTSLGDQFQFLAGVHYYFIHRLNKLHDGVGKYQDERFSLYAGLSIAHALNNYYGGLSYDIVPGVRIIGGWHFYKNYHFSILDNSIADQASGISSAGFFMSLNLEPIIVGKSIGLFK